MRWQDIRSSITSTLKKRIPGANIYFEEVDNPKFPYYFVDLVDYKKEFNTYYGNGKLLS